ncbi:MAG: hypothetical protein KC431_20125, partial [Myxococcales bacterium]|nr:hypothetical protein [Myxococcales bacterium]
MKAGPRKAGIAATLAASSLVMAVAVAYALPGDSAPQQDADEATAKSTATKTVAPRCHFEADDQSAFVLQTAVRDVRSEETDHLR